MVLDRRVADGYGLIGGVGEYEHIWRMAYVPGRRGSSSPGRAYRLTGR
jgi:hypothetical protein